MFKIEDLKLDGKFDKLTPYSKEEFEAMERITVADKEIFAPLIVWKQENVLIDSYLSYEILKAHTELKYSIKEMEFED